MNDDKVFAGVIVVWLISALFYLALLGGAGYVAYHFITKFW